MVQQQAEEQGDEGIPERAGGATLPELYSDRPWIGRPIDDLIDKGLLEPSERQRLCALDREHEAPDQDGRRGQQEDGGRDRSESGAQDKAGRAEGQGKELELEVRTGKGPHRSEDTERGPDFKNVLTSSPIGEGQLQSGEIGGRKCCPELPRDALASLLKRTFSELLCSSSQSLTGLAGSFSSSRSSRLPSELTGISSQKRGRA